MRAERRTEELFQSIKELNDISFVGVERAPEVSLRYAYDIGDVYIHGSAGNLLGFAIVTPKGDQTCLWMLAVRPEHRGLGIGSSLLKEIIDYSQASGLEFVDLTVNVDNPAQTLYFSFGFRVVKVLQNYYGKNHGLRMRRKLK
jgi:ribosomal protein S18 acetylase RimI-like enzyme